MVSTCLPAMPMCPSSWHNVTTLPRENRPLNLFHATIIFFYCTENKLFFAYDEVVASKQTSLLPGHSPPTGRQSRNHLDPRSSSSTFKPPVSVSPFLLAGFARPYGAYQSGPWFRRGGMPPIASGRLASGRWPPCSWPPTWPSPLLRTPQSPCPGATFS